MPPELREGVTAMRIHPRLVPVAQAKLQRLKSQVRVTCSNVLEQLENVVVQMQIFVAQHDNLDPGGILAEYERVITEIRDFAISEVFDMAGILAVQRRLATICEDLDAVRGAAARDVPKHRSTTPGAAMLNAVVSTNYGTTARDVYPKPGPMG